ncbi:MAG: Dna2/Cas4 domain-containing protein, partial [Melioribacteraceae bacterium]|nr:Dna2/Cas4 domain-containing protein [Melioribacteraceae bacterium]
VELSEKDEAELERIKKDINSITELEYPPEVINKPFCKKCSYYDLCYI